MARVHWLERRAQLDRTLRWTRILTFVFVAGMGLAGLFLFGWLLAQLGADPAAELSAQVRRVGVLMLLGMLALLSIFPIVGSVTRALRRRVGADGNNIHLELDDGRRVLLAPSRVLHTRRMLLYERYSFPLRNQQGKSFYAEGELETWLEPLLEDSEQLSPWKGLLHQWKNRDAMLLWPLASTTFLLAIMALAGLLGLL